MRKNLTQHRFCQKHQTAMVHSQFRGFYCKKCEEEKRRLKRLKIKKQRRWMKPHGILDDDYPDSKKSIRQELEEFVNKYQIQDEI